ncbi:GntR family transcriptional regulator [Desertimonas flava]|uniref:GntR family transcriptional regulator n=1 Tax=Desertimonas flava TaxID=2064846 RepID=UPI000E346ACF|nr:GntR family transcriptional regulator [Desertimonas flava]
MSIGIAEEAVGAQGSTTDRIVTALQRRIVTGEVPIGTWLRHGALAEEFAVSRTPIREALRVLAAQGVVTIVPNRGARVNGLSSREVREIGEVRGDLQALAAELAAERSTDDHLRRMNAAWEKFAKVLNSGRKTPADLGEMWAAANEEFHGVIVEAAHNRQLASTLGDLHRRIPRNLSFSGYAGHSHLLRRNLDEHLAIAEAITDHDPVEARAKMLAHCRGATQNTARWLESRAVD